MDAKALQRNQQQIRAIHDHLLTIRRNMEGLISENRQLRDGLAQASQRVEALEQQNNALLQKEQHHETERLQLEQCVDDALGKVEQVLAQLPDDDGDETESTSEEEYI